MIYKQNTSVSATQTRRTRETITTALRLRLTKFLLLFYFTAFLPLYKAKVRYHVIFVNKSIHHILFFTYSVYKPAARCRQTILEPCFSQYLLFLTFFFTLVSNISERKGNVFNQLFSSRKCSYILSSLE